jgi:iron complex transport system permease protein
MPPQDMPIGVLTGIIGGLFFIGLLRWRKAGAE